MKKNFQKVVTNFKEVQYNCNVHCSVQLFIIAVSSHSYISWKQPQKSFLQYSCSVTMINIVNNICEGKFMNKTTWSDLLIILSYKQQINILQINCCKITTVAAFALLLSSACKSFVFSENSPIAPYFFQLKSFLWKGLLTVKVRKKIIDQILGYISFCFEIYAHLCHPFA